MRKRRTFSPENMILRSDNVEVTESPKTFDPQHRPFPGYNESIEKEASNQILDGILDHSRIKRMSNRSGQLVWLDARLVEQVRALSWRSKRALLVAIGISVFLKENDKGKRSATQPQLLEFDDIQSSQQLAKFRRKLMTYFYGHLFLRVYYISINSQHHTLSVFVLFQVPPACLFVIYLLEKKIKSY